MGSATRLRLRKANQREWQRWPVEQRMEGWLQWDGSSQPAIPVEIVNFSAGGVAVWVASDLDLPGHRRAVLITHAHGRGCGSRRVKACWQRKGATRSLLGLAFES